MISEATVIPYARSMYDNSDYVSTMANLMRQASADRMALLTRRGDRAADAWQQAGNITMKSMAGFADSRAMERELAWREQQRQDALAREREEMALRRQEMSDRADERRLDRERYQRQEDRQTRQDFEATADKAADRVRVGARITPEAFAQTYLHPDGRPTSAAESFVTAAPDYGYGVWAPEFSDPKAQPWGFERVPSQAEWVQQENLDRMRESTEATIANMAYDNRRQAERDRNRTAYENASLDLRRAANEQAKLPEQAPAPLSGDSQDIMGHTGLSYNAFLTLTGKMASLPRDRATRTAASNEVQAWARSRGVDISTLMSQFKAINETLEANITRRNNVLSVQDELVGDIANLKTAAEKANLTRARAANWVVLWARGELNSPEAADYAFALNAFANDLARYNAASTGRAPLAEDLADAKRIIQKGMARGSLAGFENSLNRSVGNMNEVLERAIDRSRKDLWTVFGVGDKYKSTLKPKPTPKSDFDREDEK